MSPTLRNLLLITLLAVTLRVTWGVVRFNDDVLNVNLGDYDLYEAGAEHWLVERDFTNSLFLVRPPLFPLLIAALGNDRLVVLIANAVVGGLITPLTYAIARRLGMTEKLALGAALLFAIDFLAIAYGAALLDPIPWGNFFLVLMLLLLLTAVQIQDRQRSTLLGAAAGLSLVVSILFRPESYLIWTGLSVWLWIVYRHQWRALVAYALISVIGFGAWTIHNGIVFGNYSFSTVSAFTVAFYRAASVERIGSGDDIETVYMNITRRVEERIGNDPDAATPDTRWGYHAAPPDVQHALTAVSRDIFRTYPLIYVATFPVGFVRMYALDPPFLRSTPEPLAMYLAVGWNWLFFLSAVAGLIIAFHPKRWLLFWCAFLLAGYYTTGTLIVKNAALVGRERAVLTPLMAMTAVVALNWLAARRQAQE